MLSNSSGNSSSPHCDMPRDSSLLSDARGPRSSRAVREISSSRRAFSSDMLASRERSGLPVNVKERSSLSSTNQEGRLSMAFSLSSRA